MTARDELARVTRPSKPGPFWVIGFSSRGIRATQKCRSLSTSYFELDLELPVSIDVWLRSPDGTLLSGSRSSLAISNASGS